MRQTWTTISLLALAVFLGSCSLSNGPISAADCYSYAREQNSGNLSRRLGSVLSAAILGSRLRGCNPEDLRAGQADGQAARERRQLDEIEKGLEEQRRHHEQERLYRWNR